MAVAAVTAVGHSQTIFDFEGTDPLSHPAISGDKSLFEVSTAQAHSGTKSLRFADKVLEPYESWTYDLPFNMTSGTVTVWFYDVRGASATYPHHLVHLAKWGGSVILEDKNNPADFGAVELTELPYGSVPSNPSIPGRYYASEGEVNRGDANSDSFDADSLPRRSTGFHRIEFHVTPTSTKIYLDGHLANEAEGPGSTGDNLRLRFMYDSASAGGLGGNWYSAPDAYNRGRVDSEGNVPDWIYYDNITISSELPSAQSHTLDFEVVNETPDYDSGGEFLGPDVPPIFPNDNPYMSGFVNQWAAVTSATIAKSGNAAARFANVPAPWKSIEFDLAGATAGSSVTLWFYDAQGPDGSYDDPRTASIIIENGNNPSDFHAIEVTNMPFPHNPPYQYPLTKGSAADGPSETIFSRAFMPRTVGWHEVEIGLYETHSELAIDGQVARYIASSGIDNGLAMGPGLDENPKLRIMGDSATVGGVDDYTLVNPLTASFQATREPFAFFDDISIPINNANVNDWMNY